MASTPPRWCLRLLLQRAQKKPNATTVVAVTVPVAMRVEDKAAMSHAAMAAVLAVVAAAVAVVEASALAPGNASALMRKAGP